MADAIRRMKQAPANTTHHERWDDLELGQMGSSRQVDGFSMGVWLAAPRSYDERRHGGCRTIGCIAGTTVALFRKEIDDADADCCGEPWENIVEVATDILGLDMERGDALFLAPEIQGNLGSITREQAATACEKTAAGCKPEDIWSHI